MFLLVNFFKKSYFFEKQNWKLKVQLKSCHEEG